MSDVAVVMTCWFPPGDAGQLRKEAAILTMVSYDENLRGADLTFYINDDGSAGEHQDFFDEIRADRESRIVLTQTPRLGCGGALNRAIGQAFADGYDVVFYAADDWELSEPFDLGPSLELMAAYEAAYIRIGMTHPNLAMTSRRHVAGDRETWFANYEWSRGGYVYAQRPALHHRRLYDRVGWYKEGVSAIEAERDFNERCEGRGVRFFHAPNATLAGPFRHIETVELGEDTPEELTRRYA